MNFRLLLLATLCAIFTSCNNEDDIFESEFNHEYSSRSLNDDEERQKILDIIQKYNLQRVDPSEYSQSDLDKLSPISSAEQLETALNALNNPVIEATSCTVITRAKTRSESEGQRTAKITGTNNNGTVTVYVDLDIPTVTSSDVNFGLMSLFLGYEHKSGNASKNGTVINFEAHGECIFKISAVDDGIYRTNTTILGHCNSDGTGGVLTQF